METNGNPSLFNQEDEITPSNAKLDVVKAEFVETESLSWEELFDGFDRLRAITYSSGIDFICKLLKKFERAEIIFGFEGVMAYNLQEIMAYQIKTVEQLKEKSSKNKIDLIKRIDSNALRLYVTRKQLIRVYRIPPYTTHALHHK
jgi:hypothetical protein